MALIVRLAVLASLALLSVVMQHVTDARHEHLPWYFLHTILVGLIPMLWLLWELRGRTSRTNWLSFTTTSAIFIVASASAELIAVQERFWWFYTDIDPLLGIYVGEVPLEEFFFYPLFLNLPVLFYMYLEGLVPSVPHAPKSSRTRQIQQIAGALMLVVATALFVNALLTRTPPADYALQPAIDAGGAIRYDTGPAQHGWTIVQAYGWAVLLFLWAAHSDRIDRRRIVFSTAVYVVIAFFYELTGCGRGWWVWNRQQVIGPFTWVIPIDSYSMYFTGATMPVVVYEALRPFFSPANAPETAPAAAPGIAAGS